MVGCIAAAAVQVLVGDRVERVAIVDYRAVPILPFALGLGAVLGELPNSFVKHLPHHS